MRKFLLGLGILAMVVTALPAEELKGKLKDVDAFKKTITVTVEGKDQVLPVADNAKITTIGTGKTPGQDVVGGILGLKAGPDVAVTTEKKDNKSIVTVIKVSPEAKKKK
jgi:hypothetical protein